MKKIILLCAWLLLASLWGSAQSPSFVKVEWYDTCTFNPVTTNWEKKLVFSGTTANTRNGALASINLLTEVAGNPMIQLDTATVINNRFYKIYDYWFGLDRNSVEMRNLYPILSLYLFSNVSSPPFFNPILDTVWDQVSFGNQYSMCPVYYWDEIRDCRTMNVVLFTDRDNDCYYDRFDDPHWHSEIAVYRNNTLDRIIAGTSKFRRGLNLFDTGAVTNDAFLVKPLFSTSCLPGNEFRVKLDTLAGRNNRVDMGLLLNNSPDLILNVHGTFRVQSSNSYITLDYFNNYTGSSNAYIEYTIPDNYSFVSTSHTNYTIAGNIINFNLGILPSAARGQIDLRLMANNIPRAADTILQTATIFPLAGDAVPADNVYRQYETVLASYDPNQKTAVPQHYLPDALAPIRYIVEFENIGNDTAFSVYIEDTLSALLDINTIKIVGASHRFNLDVDGKNGSYILKFNFDAIRLPGRYHPDHNKGYIIYEIAPKAGLQKGQQIKNTAHIYFDYNEPVVTNTTSNELHPMGITEQLHAMRISIHPNPAKDMLKLDNVNGGATYAEVFDVTGRKVAVYDLKKGLNAFDVSYWNAGVYVVKCSAPDGGTVILKIVKE